MLFELSKNQLLRLRIAGDSRQALIRDDQPTTPMTFFVSCDVIRGHLTLLYRHLASGPLWNNPK
jgi:hypothetical protein